MPTKTFNISKQYMGTINDGGWVNPGDLHIPIGRWVAGGLDWEGRAALYAPISFAGMVSINSAHLHLKAHTAAGYHAHGSSTATIYALRKTADWSETTGGASASVNETWGQHGTTVVGSGYASVESGDLVNDPGDQADGTDVAINITTLVRDWFNGSPNYGLLLINATNESNASYGKEYYSRHASGEIPYIEIDYETNTPPNAPVNLSPTGSQIVNGGTVVTVGFTQSDPDAGDYMSGFTVEVWNDSLTTRLSSVERSTTGTPQSWSYNVGVPSGNTYYKWRVKTKDSHGVYGPFSAFQRFRANTPPSAPTLSLAQSPTSDILTLTPTFHVTHNDTDPNDSQAYGYHIILQRSDGSLVWDSGQVSITPAATVSKTYNGPALSWQTGYRWQAQTKDSNGAWSPYSGWATFTTHTTSAPTGLNPTGSVVVGSITPTFSGSRGANNDTLASVRIIVWRSGDNHQMWDSGYVACSSTAFSVLYAGEALANNATYYWKVAASGSTGGISNFSASNYFKTPAADAVTPVSPIGDAIATLTPTFRFTRASQAFNAYRLIVYNADGTVHWDSLAQTITSTTDYTASPGSISLAWNTTYSWKVEVSSDGGSTWGSGFSGSVNFTTDASSAAVLVSPIDQSWETSQQPTLVMQTSNGETTAEVLFKVYADDQLTIVWQSDTAVASGSTGASVQVGTALSKGKTYYWTAQYLKEPNGASGDDAPMESFHINDDPQSPSNLSPATGAVISELTPKLSATFEDDDLTTWGDKPSYFEIEIWEGDTLIGNQIVQNP